MKRIFVFGTIVLFLDQSIKGVLLHTLNFGEQIEIINNFFNITLLKNTGAAFSMFTSSTWFLILISIAILFLIYFFFIRNNNLKKSESILYGFLIGGTMGNLFDRILYKAVVDYLAFDIFKYSFPVFNLADSCIVMSVILLVIMSIKGDKNEVSSK